VFLHDWPSPAVPLPCHEHQLRRVSTGHPRSTRQRPRPRPLVRPARRRLARTSFGSKGSPVQIGPSRPPARTSCSAGVPTAPHSA